MYATTRGEMDDCKVKQRKFRTRIGNQRYRSQRARYNADKDGRIELKQNSKLAFLQRQKAQEEKHIKRHTNNPST